MLLGGGVGDGACADVEAEGGMHSVHACIWFALRASTHIIRPVAHPMYKYFYTCGHRRDMFVLYVLYRAQREEGLHIYRRTYTCIHTYKFTHICIHMCIYIHAATVEAGARPTRREYEPPSTELQSNGKRNYPIRVHDVMHITPTYTYMYVSIYFRYICTHLCPYVCRTIFTITHTYVCVCVIVNMTHKHTLTQTHTQTRLHLSALSGADKSMGAGSSVRVGFKVCVCVCVCACACVRACVCV
jgi:hypothetical protein